LRRALCGEVARRGGLSFTREQRFLIAHGLLLLLLLLLPLGEPACLGSVPSRLCLCLCQLRLLLLSLQGKFLLQRLLTRRVGSAPRQRFLRRALRLVIDDRFRGDWYLADRHLLGRVDRLDNRWRRTGVNLG